MADIIKAPNTPREVVSDFFDTSAFLVSVFTEINKAVVDKMHELLDSRDEITEDELIAELLKVIE